MKVEHLTFSDAVEQLASKLGMELRRAEGAGDPRWPCPDRPAHRGPPQRAGVLRGAAARDRQPACPGGAGLPPGAGLHGNEDPPTSAHWLSPDGLRRAERVPARARLHRRRAGHVRSGGTRSAGTLQPVPRAPRLADPQCGDTVGFGARRLSTTIGWRPSTSTRPRPRSTKKSQVLYGLDLARKPMSTERQAVIVEGYTDVMAMHLSA